MNTAKEILDSYKSQLDAMKEFIDQAIASGHVTSETKLFIVKNAQADTSNHLLALLEVMARREQQDAMKAQSNDN